MDQTLANTLANLEIEARKRIDDAAMNVSVFISEDKDDEATALIQTLPILRNVQRQAVSLSGEYNAEVTELDEEIKRLVLQKSEIGERYLSKVLSLSQQLNNLEQEEIPEQSKVTITPPTPAKEVVSPPFEQPVAQVPSAPASAEKKPRGRPKQRGAQEEIQDLAGQAQALAQAPTASVVPEEVQKLIDAPGPKHLRAHPDGKGITTVSNREIRSGTSIIKDGLTSMPLLRRLLLIVMHEMNGGGEATAILMRLENILRSKDVNQWFTGNELIVSRNATWFRTTVNTVRREYIGGHLIIPNSQNDPWKLTTKGEESAAALAREGYLPPAEIIK